MNYKGVIIEESLKNKSVLKGVKILSTKIEPVTEADKTPWLLQWTLHTVEVPEDFAESFAEKVKQALETEHTAWYADFKNDTTHFIIFPGKIFQVDRTKVEEYKAVTDYGISLGIPEYQLNFLPEII